MLAFGREYLGSIVHAAEKEGDNKVREFHLGGSFFDFNSKPRIMGVINLSPDSWYRESVCPDTDQAVKRAHVLTAQGAAMIDLGAESSLSYTQRRCAEEQKARLCPVVSELAASGIITSVETYDLGVAEAALEAGAKVVNFTGTRDTARLYGLAAEHDAAVIICFIRGEHIRAGDESDKLSGSMDAIIEYFVRELDKAKGAGLDKVFIDPGIGFSYVNSPTGVERVKRQAEILLHSFKFHRLGAPVCNALPCAFEFFGDEVRTGEAFFSVLAGIGGTHLFRTHEVAKVKGVLDILSLF
ncbi:MAG: dihydropteroate synthase [Verrucomicrobia bacterium]|nr:dihydropteroate synthase [Verrucomicrobiota bacterium]